MQQVVVYELRSVHSANAAIGRTQNFEDQLEVDDLHVPLKLRAALYMEYGMAIRSKISHLSAQLVIVLGHLYLP